MTNLTKPSVEPLGWRKSFLWLALAVACFHLAYTSLKFPAAGLLIFGYAFGLVKLADQPNVRRAFYFGLAAGFLCYAPQACLDRKSTRLNSSHLGISYAVFCL